MTAFKNRPRFNLTQLCRQLQTEFLPTYFATLHVAIYLSDLPAYTSVLLETYSIGNVHVKDLDLDEQVDVRAALLLDGTVPDVTSDFGVEANDLIPIFADVAKDTEFLALLLSAHTKPHYCRYDGVRQGETTNGSNPMGWVST